MNREPNLTRNRRRALRGCVLACLGAVGVTALARPPVVPLPIPRFSLDLASPSLDLDLGAQDVLAPAQETATIAIPGAALGLLRPGDDLNALSGNRAGVGGTTPFVLLFSVDRASTGTVPPDPTLDMLGVAYNVTNQAERGQAAGDLYFSLDAFVLSKDGGLRSRVGANALGINNYDEGGTSFAVQPAVSAQDLGPPPADDVDAVAELPPALRTPPPLYFSVTRDSPSLLDLPGNESPSGAHLFFNVEPGFSNTTLFATYAALGLTQMDDIDALVIVDVNSNGVFDGIDRVLFSLAPGSPSLSLIPGASFIGAEADVFIATPEFGLQVLAPAAELGLGNPGDNINALEIYPLDQPVLEFALQHGIRAWLGDMNCDGVVNFFDIDPFVMALATPSSYREVYPWCRLENGDTNCDGMVNFFDIDPFVVCLTGGDCACGF